MARRLQALTFIVYATEGRRPTDADAERIMKTEVKGVANDNVHIYAVRVDGALAGGAFLLRGFPKPEVAYVTLVILAEEF